MSFVLTLCPPTWSSLSSSAVPRQAQSLWDLTLTPNKMYIKTSGWGNCWLNVMCVSDCWCSLLVTSAGFPNLLQFNPQPLLLLPKFTQSPALNTWPVQANSPHPALASKVSLQTLAPLSIIMDPSPSSLTLQQALSDRPQEAVDRDAVNMWLPKLQDDSGLLYNMFARAGSEGLLGIWSLGESYIGISQLGPSTVKSHVLELVYSLGNHFTGSSSGTN